jgi:hypothetical protein
MPSIPLLRKQLVAVVDTATTMICLDAAGQIRNLDDTFDTLNGSYQYPPFHRWCRSTIAPFMDGFVTPHRAAANAEINRRPPKERRKGPGGTGARRIPPPHQDTYERRGELTTADYLPTFDALPAPDERHHAALTRYRTDPTETDRQLRAGELDDDTAQLVEALDEALRETTLPTQLTAFTAIRTNLVTHLEVDDILAEDSYLTLTLDPVIASTYGHPIALTIPAGHPAVPLDRDTQQILLPRRHSWTLIALGAILIGLLL